MKYYCVIFNKLLSYMTLPMSLHNQSNDPTSIDLPQWQCFILQSLRKNILKLICTDSMFYLYWITAGARFVGKHAESVIAPRFILIEEQFRSAQRYTKLSVKFNSISSTCVKSFNNNNNNKKTLLMFLSFRLVYKRAFN